MRITIVTGFFLPVPAEIGGSTEKIWYGLAKIFATSGHSVTFVSRIWPGQENKETAHGINHIRIPGFNHTRSLPMNLLLDFIWGIRVARVLPRGDVVICNAVSLPVWLNFLVPSAGKVAIMLGRKPKGQIRYYRGVARIYAPSAFIANEVTAEWAKARVKVTGYPIDWTQQAHSSSQKPPPVVVGFVGRLHPEKGLDLLVSAALKLATRSELPEWRIKVVGPDSVRDGGGGSEWISSLRRTSEQILGARIEWLPAEYDPARLAILFGTMDIFCYPSVAEKGETFGVAVAEAMAARCAAVVSGLGCFGDLVREGETGLVFDHRAANSDELLANCIGRLISDSRLRADLAMRGQRHAQQFDYPEVSRKILEDLTLLTSKGPASV
jgi:glycosyltransferase involved in cell wall biosynthesis